MAEAIMRRLLEQRGVKEIQVASAGTGAFDGAPASEGSYLVGLEQGLDLSAHRSRPLTRELVQQSDLILCMSAHHRERVSDLGGAEKTYLLGAYAGRRGEDAAVSDPYGLDLEQYRVTFTELTGLLESALARLQAERRHDQR